jgi:hypothetical protein
MKSGKLTALATTAVLALTGCASGSPQVAAYVGESQISQRQVDDVSRVLADISTDTTDSAGGFSSTVLQIMIQSKIVGLGADARKLTVAETDRQAAISGDATLSALSQNPATASFVKDYVGAQLLLQTEAGVTAAQEVAEATSIRVNPRFGTWDDSRLGLAEGSSGSLSSVAPIRQE